MAQSSHFQDLEINLISAEDLAPVSRNMKTYAIAWVQPDRKIATGVDQTGGTDPTWNEKLTFQVDDKFLNSEDATIVVEIYAAAWVKDALIGQVSVRIDDIFRLRSVSDTKTDNSASRTVTLQIRRPSGRPQGILKMEVSIVNDSTNKRSLPQITEEPKPKITSEDQKENPENKIESINHESMEENSGKTPEIKGLAVNDGSASCGSPVKGNGSMVNGDSVCCSDVGPSASVVAAAIAKGLYVPPVNNQPQSKETSKRIREWTKKEREQDLERKLERWRSGNQPPSGASRRGGKSNRRSSSTGDGKKLFSCFGNAFGCEISITCGGGKKKIGNGTGTGTGNKICNLSSVDDNYSSGV